jgi:MFS family permease
MTSMTINMTVTVLVGLKLASDPGLATLPLALQFTGTMLTTVPASLLMRRIGRRGGFSVGAILGVLGSGIAGFAIFEGNFELFCLGSAIIGAFQGFAVFYRHAAADTASDAFKGKAISLVLAGGVVAAIFGPEISKFGHELFTPYLFAGCFAIMAVLQIGVLLLVQNIAIPHPKYDPNASTGRPLSEIVRQPIFFVSAASAMIGYGVMSFVMTATPLAVVGHGFHFHDAAFIIQWHALGMFAPSFFTGSLIARFGVTKIMFIGALLNFAAIAVNLSGTEVVHFFTSLLLLGLGWNFMFVGGTTLLTQSHTPEEKAKVQGLNDFLVFGTVTCSSFASGALLNQYGWNAVNYGSLPMVAIATVLIAWLMLANKRRTTKAA